jgi:hypothetical protein
MVEPMRAPRFNGHIEINDFELCARNMDEFLAQQ